MGEKQSALPRMACWSLQAILLAYSAGLHAAVFADPATGLQWSVSDNGADIDWMGAQRYCAEMGAGWRLPVAAEIIGLYGAAKLKNQNVSCGNAVCYFPQGIRLSAPSLWSADPVTDDPVDGGELAWNILLVNGKRTKGLRDVGFGSRAICVHAGLPSRVSKEGGQP